MLLKPIEKFLKRGRMDNIVLNIENKLLNFFAKGEEMIKRLWEETEN